MYYEENLSNILVFAHIKVIILETYILVMFKGKSEQYSNVLQIIYKNTDQNTVLWSYEVVIWKLVY